ncbi:MAG: succinate dehydrogenase, cytochrome b556 subunit [Anaerolineales bacterium]|nr:succinate dehydrogenase, cytochrome b556 subunit [Anaerolineales bacterium]
MAADTNKPSPSNWWKWFDPRARDVGTWAFILNRVTALGLTFYLFLHLIVLGTLAQGPEAYDGFLKMIESPVYTFGELLVVIAGIYHGLNGIRIGLAVFFKAAPVQKQAFYVLMVVALIGIVFFAVRMFTA